MIRLNYYLILSYQKRHDFSSSQSYFCEFYGIVDLVQACQDLIYCWVPVWDSSRIVYGFFLVYFDRNQVDRTKITNFRCKLISVTCRTCCATLMVSWTLLLPLLLHRSHHVWRRWDYRPCVRQRLRSGKGWLRRRRCPQGRLPLHRRPPPSPGKQRRKNSIIIGKIKLQELTA